MHRSRALAVLVAAVSSISLACASTAPQAPSTGTAGAGAPSSLGAAASAANGSGTTMATSPPGSGAALGGATASAGVGDGGDRTRLVIGDGSRSSTPEVGSVLSCATRFQGRTGKTGPWTNGDGTFDLANKPHVAGAIEWPQASFTATIEGDVRVLRGNDLPVGHTTGVFPIQRSDPVYRFDANPNEITAQVVELRIPANPVVAASPTCVASDVPGGSIVGVMVSGVYLLSALDGAGDDAVYHEVQDACDGHPHRNGLYHYHNLSVCLPDAGSGHSSLAGYARDGFGIYGLRGEDGEVLTNEDLDACHGHAHGVDWDDAPTDLYHYHATHEYPYTAGCFRGTPAPLSR